MEGMYSMVSTLDSNEQQKLREQLQDWMENGTFYQATLSGPRNKSELTASRIVVRPVQLKEGIHYQFESYYQSKVLHENVKDFEALEKLISLLQYDYKQALIKERSSQLQVLVNKKGQLTLKRQDNKNAPTEIVKEHNRQKRRVLEEGKPVAFLIELGIMTEDGKVHAKKGDKFRQINRFLETVEDVLPHLPAEKKIKIVDFGCGKSYLTFALYHYLAVIQQRDIEVIGLDLKQEVIQFCNQLAQKLSYTSLQFFVGDIADYEDVISADMVVTLHACDTATDAAIGKAINWGASVIMTVPCCQHELFKQVKNDTLTPLLSQGLLKERFASLATDAVRGQLLEVLGYRVQMLEFIDPEHTPKNLMIRAIKPDKDQFNEEKWKQYVQFKEFLNIDHTLEKVLQARLPEH